MIPADYTKCLAWLKGLVGPFVKEELNNFKYETSLRELEAAINDLQKEKEAAERKAGEEGRYGRRNDDVKKWTKHATDLISEYENFRQDERHAYAVFDLFTTGYLPKPGIRYRLTRKANNITRKVKDALLQMKKLDKFYWRGPLSMAAFFTDIGYESLPSRDKTVEEITAKLEDPDVRIVGVQGSSGVGKTTLVKQAAKIALEAQMFDVLIMTSVTRTPDVRRIQGQIADMLGIKLAEESEIGRAARIRERLGNEKENTLIILDDLWEKLDFNMLGFPSMNDDDGSPVKNVKDGKPPAVVDNMDKSRKIAGSSTMVKGQDRLTASNTVQTEGPLGRRKGCKILMISENEQVLSSQVDGKRNSVFFSIERLKGQEPETLFTKVAGIGDDKNSELEKLAAQIASKCGGLPMSIVTTAKALKNQKSHSVWENSLRKLESEMFSGKPDASIKLSYELLENEELKCTFLLCARMRRDILVMDFVRYCIGLGLLQGIHTVAETRDAVLALLLELKESGLLSRSYSRNSFTMQDIVQRAALSIASEEKQVFMRTKGKIDEWPDKDELERYTAISLLHCDIIEFPESIKWSRLKVMHVDSLDPHLKIPDNCFEEMLELRVLILIGIHLSPLPSTLRYLTKLRMLCLERCMLDEGLSIIGELKNLRILSFAGSDLKRLPDELKKLARLQIFDISECSKLVIPPKIISSLTSLEDLYMRHNSIQWKVEGQENQSENASLSELRDLNQLTTLDIRIPNVAHLPKDLFLDKLDNYKIVIGDSNSYLERDFRMPNKYEASRFLALHLKVDFDIHEYKGIKMLFERVENLLLGELHGVEHVFYELNLKGFPYLKHLSIVSNSNIQCIVKSTDEQHPEMAFVMLESVRLHKLINMEHICHGKFQKSSFGKLKIMKISICDKLKNVFLSSMVGFLTALETIEASECNSLKEIVTVDIRIDEMKFPELRFLKLQSLSEFVGFYTRTEDPNRELRELFEEKVVVSELERVELSSLKIQKIWSDTPSSSSYFKKLTHMDVSDCGNLTYLLSFSMAKNLVNLQSLFVSKCDMMENIFKQEEVGKDSIFPKLKNIKLSCLKRLMNIWQSKDPLDSYEKLDSVIIEDCDKLHHVFATDMVGRFRSLCNLRVTRCKSMQVIFDLENDGNRDAGPGGVTNLHYVHLEALPKLKHIWKNEPEGAILNFQSLQKIGVRQCPSLVNIFPASVATAKGLEKLENLVVRYCGCLEHIVAKGESSNGSSIPFEFPELSTIQFSELPKLGSFYPGEHKLSCPALSNLSVELCDQLEPFIKKPAENPIKPAFFHEEIIYNLKFMQVEQRDAKWLKDYIGDYRLYNLEELHFSTLVDYEILYFFLYRSANLKSLWLSNCFFEELVPHASLRENKKLGFVPKLKMLKLTDLPSLQDIGFERDIILQRIEFLILNKCPRLTTILLPPSVSFTHLTYLEVVNCGHLTSLMELSTAKSLVQLTTMKVIQCRQMKEIVSQKGNGTEMTIVFRQLKALELVSLPCLTCFCSSQSCAFVFPSLQRLVVSLCPGIKTFTWGENKPPNLREIHISHRRAGPRYCLWEGDINATIQKISEDMLYLEGVDKVELGNHWTLIAWDKEVQWQGFSFDSLKTLKLRECNFGKVAITATLLRNLKNLKKLLIQNCSNFKFIFDKEDNKGATFLLEKLTLDGLPKLEYVWDNNSEGLVSFQNLQKVVVADCRRLKAVFPVALAKNLKKLEELNVRDCKELLEIVEQEEEIAEGSQELLFPSLSSLNLSKLPQLTYFHSERVIGEELNRLDVLSCGKLELFQCEQEARPEGQGGTSANREPISSAKKVIQNNLEALTLNWKDTQILCERQVPLELDKLNQLKLWFDDANAVHSLPFELFVKGVKAPDLELLQVSRCSGLKEIFPSQNDNEIGEDGILGHLNKICVLELFDLKSIGLEHSWVSRLCEQLHTLTVTSCPRLTTLIVQVQPAVSFSHLKQLTVEDCSGMKNLFTSSVAKKLNNLQEMHIRQCESMEEIVAEEQSEITSAETIFERLKTIVLDSLTRLQSFYPGKDTLQLPSLMKVVIRQCPKMRFFSQRFKLAESSSRILVSLDSDDALVLHRNLNAKVEEMFLRQANLRLGDYPLLRKIWLGEVQVSTRICFSNLKSLVVEGCDFLLDAILPSHLLSSLRNLEELQVRKCNYAKVIVEYKGPASDPLSISLKKLILEKLPNLKHIWNNDPKGSLHFSCLEEVSVDGCESIITLLLPVAIERLKKLNVSNCKGLVEIVAKDEQDTNRATKPFIPFISEGVRLWSLPNLKRIYPGMFNLGWPLKLKASDISLCQILTILEAEFQNAADSNANGQDRSPTYQQALDTVKLVTRRLEQLSLNKEDMVMITQGQFDVDLQNLKFLKFQFFDKSDVFPYWFLSKVSLLSIEKLGVVESAFEEIFPSQKPDIDDVEIISQLKGLELDRLSELKSIGFEHSWTRPLIENLQTLVVLACSSLTKLAPSTVSFSHLAELIVENSKRLQYLFTSSTAKSLGLLNKISITNCISMETIVAKEGDELDKDEMIFGNLKILFLSKLPILGSFYTGFCTLNFPSLEEVSFTRCHKMKIFCNGDVVPKNMEGKIDGIRWHGDLNTVIKRQSQEESSQRNVVL